MIKSYNDVLFEEMELQIGGELIHGLYVDDRVDEETLPEGKYLYELQHDKYFPIPRKLERKVYTDFYGTFITDEELEFEYHLLIDDWNILVE